MKKWLQPLMAVLLLLALVSCKSSDLRFNNKVVEIQQGLSPKLDAFGLKMAGLQSENLREMAPDATKLSADLQTAIDQLKALETPKHGEEFKRSVIAGFEYMKKICAQTVKMGEPATTMEEKMAIAQDFLKAEEEMKKMDEDVKRNQRAFAKESGFRLEAK
jgi:hypothetical protein